MEKNQITEEKIREVLSHIIEEEVSKIKREDFARLLYKLDDFERSLVELMREFHKIDNSTPTSLKFICRDKTSLINNNLLMTHKQVIQLKEKIKLKRKRQANNDSIQQITEKKKRK